MKLSENSKLLDTERVSRKFKEPLTKSMFYGSKEEFEYLNQRLKNIQRIAKLVKSLHIQEGSPLEAKRQKFLEAMDELEDYGEKHSGTYKNLNIATKNVSGEEGDFLD